MPDCTFKMCFTNCGQQPDKHEEASKTKYNRMENIHGNYISTRKANTVLRDFIYVVYGGAIYCFTF